MDSRKAEVPQYKCPFISDNDQLINKILLLLPENEHSPVRLAVQLLGNLGSKVIIYTINDLINVHSQVNALYLISAPLEVQSLY